MMPRGLLKMLVLLEVIFLFAGVVSTVTAGEQDKLKDDIAFICKNSFDYSKKSSDVIRYRIKKDVFRLLGNYEWFSVWYKASPAFRNDLDWYVNNPHLRRESEESPSIFSGSLRLNKSVFQNTGSLSVTSELPDVCIYLNSVFIGRTPLEEMIIPSDNYIIGLGAKGKYAWKNVKVKNKDQITVEFGEEDFTELPESEQKQNNTTPKTAWRREVQAEKILGIYPYGRSVIQVTVEDGTIFRSYEKDHGCLEWTAKTALVPASPLLIVSDCIVWGGLDCFLHSIDLLTGEESLVVHLGGDMTSRPVIAGHLLLCASWDQNNKKGRIKAIDLAKSREEWSKTLNGKPLDLFTVNRTVLIITKEESGISMVISLAAEDGTKKWERWISESENMILTGDSDNLFLWGGGKDDRGYLVDPETGQDTVRLIVESDAAITDAKISEGIGIFVTAGNQICAYELESAELLWRNPLAEGYGNKTQILDFDRHYIKLFSEETSVKDTQEPVKGLLSVLSTETGRSLYTRKKALKDQIRTVGRNRILIIDAEGNCVLRDLERNFNVWSYNFRRAEKRPGAIFTAVDKTTIYLLSKKKKKLYAF